MVYPIFDVNAISIIEHTLFVGMFGIHFAHILIKSCLLFKEFFQHKVNEKNKLF